MPTPPAPLDRRLTPTLPPAPSTTFLHETATTRLDTLTRDLLPALRDEREFLHTVWYSEAANAHLLHMGTGHLLGVDPRGVDRLSSVLATEEALAGEQEALHELLRALEDYAAGGRQMCALLEDPESDEDGPGIGVAFASRRASGHTVLRPEEPPEPASASGEAYTRRLRAYLVAIEHDLARAVMAGCAPDVAQYSLERDGVRERLGQQLSPTTARDGIRAPLSGTRAQTCQIGIRCSA